MNEMKKKENKEKNNKTKPDNNDNSDKNCNEDNSINDDQDNNTNLYSDISSIDDYKRIFSKVVEQRVKVNAKNWTAKSSPLKESLSINYSTKIIKNKNNINKHKNQMIIFNVKDTKTFTTCIHPSKLMNNSKFCSLTKESEKEILSNLSIYNVTLMNTLNKNINKYDFNSLISYYLYYLLNIIYLSLPYMKTKKIKPTGLNIQTAEKLYIFFINLINENLYDFNDNYNERFIKCVNYIAKVNSVESEPTPTLTEDSSLLTNNLLLKASEKSKLKCIRYIIYYLESPKNKISSMTRRSKKSKLIHLEFLPLISYANNLLNIKYLKRDKNYRTYKKLLVRSYKEGYELVNELNNGIIKIDHFIWDTNDNQNSNLIISYFDDNNSLIDTVYPTFNKEYNCIHVPQVNDPIDYKNLAIYNNHQINNNNDHIITTFFTKSPFSNTNFVNNQKMDFLLPVLNNNKILNGYRKIIMDSYITFPSLRQRKTCIFSNSNNVFNDDYEEKKNFYIDKRIYRNKQFGKF